MTIIHTRTIMGKKRRGVKDAGRASAFTFFQSFFAHFLRLCRKKLGYPGFRFAPFPPLTLRERFAPLLSLAPRKIFTILPPELRYGFVVRADGIVEVKGVDPRYQRGNPAKAGASH
jgi:hypothetical protein